MELTAAQQHYLDNLRKHALEYINRGWSIFPVSLSSKKPLAEWRQYQTRRPTREEVEEWFTLGAPTASGERVQFFNLSVATGAISGIVILDCDNEKAVEFAMQNKLCSPFNVATTRGMHFYFAHPNNGVRYANKVGGVGKNWPEITGLDFRGDGGYALIPPSIKFDDSGNATHQYEWSDCPYDYDAMPVWNFTAPSVVDVTNVSADDFRFENLSLSATRVASPESALSVLQQAEEHIAAHGKLGEGQGRNQWLIRYAGEQVRRGILGKDLLISCEAFQQKIFATPLPDEEFKNTIMSAVSMDKRNHPSDYNEDGSRKDAEVEAVKKITGSIIYYEDIVDLRKEYGRTKYLIDPLLSPGTITQVVGYNGHGKSVTTYGMVWCLAVGIPYGPFDILSPHRVLYLDYETPINTFMDRADDFAKMFGHPRDNLAMWSMAAVAARKGEDMSLASQDGITAVFKLLEQVQPSVVVIDTVRSAFPSLDERSPEAWAHVNALAKAIRNAGVAVILIHHRNKPGEHGLGRESGSTAQLTDIDTQLFITSVYRKEEDAKKRASLLDSKLSVEDASGKEWSPYGYLENKIDTSTHRIRSVTQLDFGKVRQWTDNHTENYIGISEDLRTGELGIVSTLSPKQKAVALLRAGTPTAEIAMKLFVPLKTVMEWLAPQP